MRFPMIVLRVVTLGLALLVSFVLALVVFAPTTRHPRVSGGRRRAQRPPA